jgi:hypothetical protein
MKDVGLQADEVTYALLISVCEKAGQKSERSELLGEQSHLHRKAAKRPERQASS